MAIYGDAMAHAHLVSLQIDGLVNPTARTAAEWEDRINAQPNVQIITSRMLILGHKKVLAAWETLLDSDETLRWCVSEDEPGFRQFDPEDSLPRGYPPLVAAREAIKEFEALARRSLNVNN